ncbi:gas vesicle protein GvpO [Saccharopolyspora sp. NPDC000359]|uniref:gas vesicle protein GvpO n=1 Tax=Saccharopolyspora sp. NPDC000359 TaxID=3154251 RepID=UPI0033262192
MATNRDDRDVEERRPRRREQGGSRQDSEPEERGRTRSAEPERSRERRPALKAADIAQLALRQVHQLTGKDPEGVTSLTSTDDGWVVAVEVVEAHRVPNTADILAIYEAELDEEGDLVSYRRINRYSRGQGD